MTVDMSSEANSVISFANSHERQLRKTARGRLQSKRCKLNEQMSKELRMRSGAENLYRATSNKKLKEQITVELSFFNSNVQLLKEQLSDLNSSVEVYQHDNCSKYSPMIPLGLKETKELDFSNPIKDVILEQYSHDPEAFTEEIRDLNSLRQATRTPGRSYAGVELLIEYFSQLCFVERRFFFPNRPLSLHFHWYDSLTGVPSVQKAIGFEKGSVLFNIGSLFTQIGCKRGKDCSAKHLEVLFRFDFMKRKEKWYVLRIEDGHSFRRQLELEIEGQKKKGRPKRTWKQQVEEESLKDRSTFDGVVAAREDFQRAAGAYRYLDGHFRNAPSMDMQPEILDMLCALFLAQAQECVLEELIISHGKDGAIINFQMAEKAACVAEKYRDTYCKMSVDVVKSYLPFSWISMAQTKEFFYKGLAHYYVAMALIGQKDSACLDNLHAVFNGLFDVDMSDDSSALKLPTTQEGRILFGRTNLREAVLCHEEALRVHGLCRQVRKIDLFLNILQQTLKRSVETFALLEDEDDFSDFITAPCIVGKSSHNTKCLSPNFTQSKDIFWKLGPIQTFNKNNTWSTPRIVLLQRPLSEGFGFSVCGDCPVAIADIELNSVAGRSGMLVGDVVVGVEDADTKWACHDDVVQLVRQAGCELRLTLVTMSRPAAPDSAAVRPFNTVNIPCLEAYSKANVHSDTSSNDSSSQNGRFSAPWIFRQVYSRDKNKNLKIVARGSIVDLDLSR